MRRRFVLFSRAAESDGLIRDVRYFEGAGFLGLDAASDGDEARLLAFGHDYIRQHLSQADIHPDAWQPAVIRNPEETQTKLLSVAAENTVTATWTTSPTSSAAPCWAFRRPPSPSGRAF